VVGLQRIPDYRGVGLEGFHCIWKCTPLVTTPGKAVNFVLHNEGIKVWCNLH